MSHGRVLMVVAALGVVSVGTARAQVIFFDDFESYADTFDLVVPGAWGDGQDAGQPPAGMLAVTGGSPGQCLLHNGGETNRHEIPLTFATDADPVIWEFDFIDPGNSSNRRITGGLRVGTTAFIIEMGVHNNNDNPEDGGTNVAGYAVRTALLGGPSDDGGWICFVGNPGIRAGVHHFKATLRAGGIDFELDLDDDGTVDAVRSITTNDLSIIGWDILRIGGPSDLSSLDGGGCFDNVSIRQGEEACLCEWDGDPGIDVFDLLAYLDGWFTADPVADVDGMPGVNVFDLLFFLDCWFPALAGGPCP